MLRYRINRKQSIELTSLALIPASVARMPSVWGILSWACDDISVLDPIPMSRIQKMFRQWETDSKVTLAQVISMLSLIEKHSAALEFDLIGMGLRLRDCPSDRLNWRDLWVIVTHGGQESRVYAALNQEGAGWTRSNMLLADIADSLSWLVWAKTKAAAKGGSPPDRIPRPGVKKKPVRDGSKVKPSPLNRIKEVYGLSDRKDEPSRSRRLSALFSE